MMRNNYRYSATLLDHCQNNDIPLLYASSASVYGGGADVRREARARARRSTSTATRSSCSTSTCGACCRSARRRSWASATSTCTARASSTRDGWRRSRLHFFNQYRDGRPRAAVRGLGRLRGRRAAARLRVGRRRRDASISISSIIPSAPGIFNLGIGTRGSRSTKSRPRRSTRAARPTARRRCRWSELVRAGAIEYIEFPPQLVGKYQSFTQADLTALRAAGYARR